MPCDGAVSQSHFDDAADGFAWPTHQHDRAGTAAIQDTPCHRIVVENLVEHVVANERLACQLPNAPAQLPQVEVRPVLGMSLAVPVDLGMRPQDVTQH